MVTFLNLQFKSQARGVIVDASSRDLYHVRSIVQLIFNVILDNYSNKTTPGAIDQNL